MKGFHQKGIGGHFIKHCVTFAKENNREIIWLIVWEENLNALKFYNESGFRKVGEKAFALGSDIQNDYIMAEVVQ